MYGVSYFSLLLIMGRKKKQQTSYPPITRQAQMLASKQGTLFGGKYTGISSADSIVTPVSTAGNESSVVKVC